uniref:Integrase core domain containing protein n=1 Tax=Solanum tuberosum TaxID=4113 RepID=M1DBW3_SOLTU
MANAESERGSQGNTSTSPPVATIEAKAGVQEEAANREDEEEITDDDTMVMYVNTQELNPALRPQLIVCYHFMWTVNRSKEFFDNATLMNCAAVTETTKHGQKYMAITWGPLNSIIVRGKSIDISEASINKMLYGSKYSAPTSVGLFEGKHNEVTSDATMVDRTSRERVLCWIAKQIAIDGENAVWVITTLTLITKASLSFPTKVSKIKDVVNNLFGAKSATVSTLPIVPHVPLDIPHAYKGPEHGESSQPSTEASTPPTSASQTPEPHTSKSGKRKHKAGELDEETPTDPAREARRQEKRAHRASKREAWEKEALEQEQRDATLVGASGSGAPAPTNEAQTDHVSILESAPIDKGVNADPTIGA